MFLCQTASRGLTIDIVALAICSHCSIPAPGRFVAAEEATVSKHSKVGRASYQGSSQEQQPAGLAACALQRLNFDRCLGQGDAGTVRCRIRDRLYAAYHSVLYRTGAGYDKANSSKGDQSPAEQDGRSLGANRAQNF